MSMAATNRKNGSALIAVLALGVVLSLLVAEFGFTLRGDLKAAGAYYDQARCYQLARSGIALAQLELARTKAYVDDYGNLFFLESTSDYENTIEEMKLYRSGIPLGDGRVSYALLRRSTALNLQELNPEQWQRLLEVACEIEDGDQLLTLADCACDWIDSDNTQRPLGAEEDTYEELEPPRYIRNGGLEFPEELLQVIGFTRAMLYGDNLPLREENDMLFGGGLFRYIIGDVSPEGQTSYQYIMTGSTAEVTLEESIDQDEIEYTRLWDMPAELYLVARGKINEAEHVILVKLEYVENQYSVTDWQDQADRKTIDRLTAYGLESTDIFLTEETDYDS